MIQTHPDSFSPFAFRLASYNLKNGFAETHAQAKPGRELRAAAQVFNLLDADVVIVQEVQDDRVLDAINQRLHNPFDHVAVTAGNYYRDLHLGVMVRSDALAITTRSHRDLELCDASGVMLNDYYDPRSAESRTLTPLKFQRDVLETRIAHGDAHLLTVFNVHLKSRLTASFRTLDNETIKLAEMRGLGEIVQSYITQNPDHAVAIAGDLNTDHDDPDLLDLKNRLGLHDVLQTDWIEANKEPVYSWQNYPSRSRLDYILINSVASGCYCHASAQIHASPSGREASDHYPVSIDLDLSRLPNCADNASDIQQCTTRSATRT